jgi:hypothetical protein
MQRDDRGYLLDAAKRNDVLELWEVEQYGRDEFGDPDYVSVYGLRPREWFARGMRLLARTAVECTRDALAERIAADVAALAVRAPAAEAVTVVDPFAGSGNTLVWLARSLRARTAVGVELDDGVHAATSRNLALVQADVELLHGAYKAALREISVSGGGLLVVFVAPPWGDALDPSYGLDLAQTRPPVLEVVDAVADAFARRPVLVAVQVYETVEPASLAAVAERLGWSRRATYDLDPPGRNHGVLLGTLGWAP